MWCSVIGSRPAYLSGESDGEKTGFVVVNGVDVESRFFGASAHTFSSDQFEKVFGSFDKESTARD